MFIDDDAPAPGQEDPAPPGKVLPLTPRRMPDWLTGPGDDMGVASDPQAPEPAPTTTTTPMLTRPGSSVPKVEVDPGLEPASATVFPPSRRPEPAPAPKAEAPPAPKAEAPPAPKAEAAPAPAAPRPARRGRKPDPSAPWAPVASSVPVPKLSLVEAPEPEPQAPVAPAAPAPVPRPVAVPGLPDDRLPAAAAAPAPAPPSESWWLVALDTLRADRRAQLAATAAVLAVVAAASWMWPRGVGTTPLSQIRRHPTDFDGREVVVRGRVGDDVFVVGNGYAFYLMQGRDTIVAFSLSRQPQPRKVVTLKGQVSTGFLDGMPRQALFEGGAAQ